MFLDKKMSFFEPPSDFTNVPSTYEPSMSRMSTTKDVDKKHIKILQEQLQKFQKKCKKYKAQLLQSNTDNKSQQEKYDAIIKQFEAEISKLKTTKTENFEQLEEYLRVQKEKDDQIDKYEKEISIFNASLSKSQKESEETLETFKNFMKNLIPDIENDCNYRVAFLKIR